MTNYKEKIMASLPTNWDIEAHLYEFECVIDTVEKISDGLPEDRTTTNALNGVHSSLSKVHAEFKARLLGDM